MRGIVPRYVHSATVARLVPDANGETDLNPKTEDRVMVRRIALAVCSAGLIALLGASTVFAGEITGNGRLLNVQGHSACANSGQEDLQWFTTDADLVRHAPTRGVPGHAQSWGQIPKVVRDGFPAFLHPGIACNPTRAQGE